MGVSLPGQCKCSLKPWRGKVAREMEPWWKLPGKGQSCEPLLSWTSPRPLSCFPHLATRVKHLFKNYLPRRLERVRKMQPTGCRGSETPSGPRLLDKTVPLQTNHSKGFQTLLLPSQHSQSPTLCPLYSLHVTCCPFSLNQECCQHSVMRIHLQLQVLKDCDEQASITLRVSQIQEL